MIPRLGLSGDSTGGNVVWQVSGGGRSSGSKASALVAHIVTDIATVFSRDFTQLFPRFQIGAAFFLRYVCLVPHMLSSGKPRLCYSSP